MSLLSVFCGEFLPTIFEGAMQWGVRCVSLHMGLQMMWLYETFITNFTKMLFSVCVRHLMVLQVVCKVEFLCAARKAALVPSLRLWLVSLHVCLESWLTAEHSWTLCTCVCSSMSIFDMSFKEYIVSKFSAALWALHAAGPLMLFLMATEGRYKTKVFIADFALKLRTMALLMPSPLTVIFEALRTVPTFQYYCLIRHFIIKILTIDWLYDDSANNADLWRVIA